MARRQLYGIKYPFTSDNEDMVYVDVNNTFEQGIASQVMHVILTPKGQRLRDPDFGTDLIKWIFEPTDGETFEGIKSEIRTNVGKYVPNVTFQDIQLLAPEGDEHARIVNVKYTIKKGMTEVLQGVSVQI